MTKAVHHAALKGAFPAKVLHFGPDCAHCRHSRAEQTGKKWIFRCKLLYDVQDAKTCEDFKDSRRQSTVTDRLSVP